MRRTDTIHHRLVVFIKRRGYRCCFPSCLTQHNALGTNFILPRYQSSQPCAARNKDKASSMASIEIAGKVGACKLAGNSEVGLHKIVGESSSLTSSLSSTRYLLRNHRALKFKNMVLRRCSNVTFLEYPFPSSSQFFSISYHCCQLELVATSSRFLDSLFFVNLLTVTAPAYKNGGFEMTVFSSIFTLLGLFMQSIFVFFSN